MGLLNYNKLNYKEAVKWFEMAARQEHAKALNDLGVCYHNGQGVLKNKEIARGYYKRAADLGIQEANTNIRILFAPPAPEVCYGCKGRRDYGIYGVCPACNGTGISR